MKSRMVCIPLLVLGIGLLLALPVSADSLFQETNTACGQALVNAASIAGVEGEVVDFKDELNYFSCHLDYYQDVDGETNIRENFAIHEIDPGLVERETTGCSSSGTCEFTSFHGYPAKKYYGTTLIGFSWVAQRDGRYYGLYVNYSKVAYYMDEVEWAAAEVRIMELAEALWQASESILPGAEDAIVTQVPQNNSPAYPTGVPQEEIPDEILPTAAPIMPPLELDKKTLGPLATSPWIPLAGGLVGAAAGWLLAVLIGSRGAAPPVPNTLTTDLVWSERPWDEAGPGYVTRAEHERTQAMLSQGYRWTKDGWQLPAESQQSADWQRKNQEALQQEDAAFKAELERKQKELEKQQALERERLLEPYRQEPQPAVRPQEVKSPWNFELSGDASIAGDMGGGELAAGMNARLSIYDKTYYDAKDLTGDLGLLGMDMGNYKLDGQFGKRQVGGGLGYDPVKGEYVGGVYGEAVSYRLTGEAVLGNQYAGVTSDVQIDGPKAEGSFGYNDGSLGGSVGLSLASVETGMGLNAGVVNVGVRGGLSFGFEFGLKVGAKTEVKLGPFKIGLTFGATKAGI